MADACLDTHRRHFGDAPCGGEETARRHSNNPGCYPVPRCHPVGRRRANESGISEFCDERSVPIIDVELHARAVGGAVRAIRGEPNEPGSSAISDCVCLGRGEQRLHPLRRSPFGAIRPRRRYRRRGSLSHQLRFSSQTSDQRFGGSRSVASGRRFSASSSPRMTRSSTLADMGSR